MRFGKTFLDNLRNRLPISSVVGSDVTLKPKGKGEFLGLCPFHNEKTPSFTVSDSKGFYHCFGCGAHGDVVKFVMEHRGLRYPDAVKDLALQAGMELPKDDYKSREEEKKIEDAYEVMEIACKWFENNLQSNDASDARIYLKERGLTSETISKFRLGFAPESWDSLMNYLKSKNIEEETILVNGLIATNENGSKKYDKFRNRIIFPIFDTGGKVIAFGGRIMDSNSKAPKYLNSPETDLFKKSYTLYAFNFAKDRAYKESKIIAVEGYMDVIMLHQAGFNYAVAPLGTALTENHIRTLWKVSKEPTLCMDGDRAGLAASKKFAENYVQYLRPGYTIKFLILPGGMDPDDFIRANGEKAFDEVLENAKPLSETLWSLNYDQADISTPEKKSEFSKFMMDKVASIKDSDVRNFYKKEYSNRLYQLGLNNSGKSLKNGQNNKNSISSELKAQLSSNINELDNIKSRIIALICYNPDLILHQEVEEVINTIHISNKNLEKMIENVTNFSAEEDASRVNYSGLIEYLENDSAEGQLEYLKTNTLKDEYSWQDDAKVKSMATWRYLLAEYNLALIEEEYNKILNTNDEDVEELFTRQSNLQNQMLDLKKARDSKKEYLEEIIYKDFV